MSFQVSGLASGLDTTALIDALMFAERATIRRLESSKADEQASLDAWSDIDGRLATLRDALTSIRAGGALDATVAESSNESVLRVTSQGTPLPGSYAFRVDSLAAAQQVSSAGFAAGTDLVGAGTATVAGGFASINTDVTGHTLSDGTYTLTVLSIDSGASEATVSFDGIEQTVSTAGGTLTVTAGDGGTLTVAELPASTLTTGSASITVVEADGTTTVNSLAASLNAAGGPVRAQVIDTGDDTATAARLVITSRETGLDHAADIDLSALSLFSGGLTTLRSAADASITLGDGGLTVTRPSNTIGDLFDGLAIDLVGTSPDEDVEVVVSADVDSRVAAVETVVDAVTATLTQLSDYSSYDVDDAQGGPLVGSFTARSVASELTNAMASVVTSESFVLLGQLGVTIQLDGTYTVDDAALREALTSDPAGVEAALLGDLAIDDDGIFDIVAGTVDSLLGDSGRIPTAKLAAENTIEALDAQIANQEVRLEAVEERYQRQFAALESLIGQLQSQSNFLTSLLAQSQGGG